MAKTKFFATAAVDCDRDYQRDSSNHAFRYADLSSPRKLNAACMVDDWLHWRRSERRLVFAGQCPRIFFGNPRRRPELQFHFDKLRIFFDDRNELARRYILR